MNPDPLPEDLRLCPHAGTFEITLTSGERASILAHSFYVEEGLYRFMLLIQGSPRFEICVFRIPASVVHTVCSV